jgi:hypothetical protein
MNPKAAACQHFNCKTLTMKIFCNNHSKTNKISATGTMTLAAIPTVKLNITTEAEIKKGPIIYDS